MPVVHVLEAITIWGSIMCSFDYRENLIQKADIS